MIRLYQGSGSSEIELVGQSTPDDEWVGLRRSVCKLLRVRNADRAAEILETYPFEVHDGSNFFGDEFSVLYLSAPLDLYVELAAHQEDAGTKKEYRTIAETISEVGPYIRFVAVDLDTKAETESVATPSLAVTSDTVERTLVDCEQLIHSRGATSGVDRIHTAFHGYLRVVCTDHSLTVPKDAGVTQLFKAIRLGHPSFAGTGPRKEDIDRVVGAMATIVDSLNPLRNRATLAHPNDAVLDEPEAMLVINGVRTLLHYLNRKTE
ncbi:abortive infection family protein [Candidatus Thiosymbion oneisti]|uniref:abortive infection family protein n=1 Tax=Candidatus Thiosymbion oneisti TaxID=589554 RepID=UPI000B7F8967|nr:abortive infection family protein [Candidatus Thiosymbion oneisti]